MFRNVDKDTCWAYNTVVADLIVSFNDYESRREFPQPSDFRSGDTFNLRLNEPGPRRPYSEDPSWEKDLGPVAPPTQTEQELKKYDSKPWLESMDEHNTPTRKNIKQVTEAPSPPPLTAMSTFVASPPVQPPSSGQAQTLAKLGLKNETSSSVYHLSSLDFIHVTDLSTNVTSLVIGLCNFIRKDSQMVVYGPEKMVTVPPRHYCVIENPVMRDKDGKVVMDKDGQARLLHADQEIRLAQEPFPLHPGEVLKQAVTHLLVMSHNQALRLQAKCGFIDNDGVQRQAGDEWLFKGPGTYIPCKEVEVLEQIKALVIGQNKALRLTAQRDLVDSQGVQRESGEEWLVTSPGSYMPEPYEHPGEVSHAYTLTDKQALHVKAMATYTDDFGVTRKNGEEWLIKMSDTETHIPNVYEEVVGVVNITTLTNRQYCVILDPCDSQGHPQLGKRKLVKGEKSFFLMPGEKLERGIQNVYVLGEDEGLILKATEKFTDGDKERKPGDRWMIRGPVEYVPPVQVEVVTKRTAIPLDENEGIYVRDVKTGRVRAVTGETYMLNQDEELWAKELPPAVEKLISVDRDPVADRGDWMLPPKQLKPRDKTCVVTFQVPHNVATQIYDYKGKKARVVYGPDLVLLGPSEDFTLLSLSGGKPKTAHAIKTLCLMLGPDFCKDIITVETADHARLSLQMAYNWHFDVADKSDQEEAKKLFSVPDFTGDVCKAIASRIRGVVAAVPFYDFHRNSTQIIQTAVFGSSGSQRFYCPQNKLVITNIDIQSVEPVDQRTRDSLQKSVQLAIEITINSQEAAARHEAESLEQEAKACLEQQKIADEAEAEKARKDLLELQAHSAAVESTGQAKAEAQSRAEAARIEGEAAVEIAKLKAEAMKIKAEAELMQLKRKREVDMKFKQEKMYLDVTKHRIMSEIYNEKMRRMVESIERDTIRSIMTSGPEMQLKLLKSLGLKSTLITDGKTPINMFNTAQGLVAGPQRYINY